MQLSYVHILHAPITLLNSINIARAVVAFIADSCMHEVLCASIYGSMPYGIHTDDTVAIRKYIM